MPKEGQRSVSLPSWVVDKAKEYFEANKDTLKYKKVTSTTGLITYWILQKLEKIDEKGSQ